MNTKNLKAYAPKARRQFIEAVTKRAAHFGIYADRIADVQFEGSAAVIEGRAFSKAEGQKRQQLAKKVEEKGFDLFARELAYTWFNRFAAIRYMELHDYLEHGLRVLSRPDQPTGFEILDHAADVCDTLSLDKNTIIDLKLDGNKEEELYRELLLGQCHYLHKVMPFLFEALDDATELLLPDNLTKTDSILHDLVTDVPEDDWQEIEVIGWLYQFYISEHKDAVIGKVVKSEDIPAATQLFTPNWIVKYLVQNSVGRQWLATYPDSELKGKMKYYIEPAEQTPEVQAQLDAIKDESLDPENIKILDPACGSGHILLEVYEVLREVYLERGYRLREIPQLILTKNIFGLDIDNRAAQLSGFALLMKAREDDRRIFSRILDDQLNLNVLSLQETSNLDFATLWRDSDIKDEEARRALQDIWHGFDIAKTLGSLIEVHNAHEPPLKRLLDKLNSLNRLGSLLQKPAVEAFKPVVQQALILSQRYDSVIANPPYIGSKYQTPLVKNHLQNFYKGYDKDLFSAFIVRNLQLTKEHGQLGFMTPFVWMFLSNYEVLRKKLISDEVISTLIQLEYSGFDGATVPICTFTLTKGYVSNYKGSYIRLSDFRGAANQGPRALEAINNKACGWFYNAKPDDFKKIPSNPIAYWITPSMRDLFLKSPAISESLNITGGMTTANNDRFLRLWHEVSIKKSHLSSKNRKDAKESCKKWFPYNKGGSYRKWFGNRDYFVNWHNDGEDIIKTGRAFPRSKDFYFKESLTYTATSSSYFGIRYSDPGFIFDAKGSSCFADEETLKCSLGFLASKISSFLLESINPTIEFQTGNLSVLPFIKVASLKHIVNELIEISRLDWDAYETSWTFKQHPLLAPENFRDTIKKSICHTIERWNALIKKSYDLESENNRLLIAAYGLDHEITPDVPLTEITLTCNPKYRYTGKLTDSELQDRQHSDTIIELISYGLGCIMGRYSLDHTGLVYANAGGLGFEELVAKDTYKSYPADNDGIIPLTNQEWFEDDATTSFRDFLKTVWGSKNLSENLTFVAESLCLNAIKPQKSESSLETIRRYLSTQFYKDHLKTYKKRPIYWLFSSGKEKAFECIVYLHRYNEGTLSRMRTEYVTPLMGKFDAHHGQLEAQIPDASPSQQRTIEKELKSLEKKQAELRTFDENLKHYADQRISIDLDDGVKVNYGKFGNLLAEVKAITGKK